VSAPGVQDGRAEAWPHRGARGREVGVRCSRMVDASTNRRARGEQRTGQGGRGFGLLLG
jgi:hypothetical protein